MNKTAVVILADGFEEIEGIAPIDVLRRAGVRVTVAGLGTKHIKSSRGLTIQADVLFSDYKDFPDVVILPGGLPGATNLAQAKEVGEFVKKMNSAQKLVAAICAAPAVVLAPLGILDQKKVTCYPGCEAELPKEALYSQERVVMDGNLITSRGPGTALEFSLEIIKYLLGKDVAESLRGKMLIRV